MERRKARHNSRSAPIESLYNVMFLGALPELGRRLWQLFYNIRQGGYVFIGVSWFVFVVFVSGQDNSKSCRRILIKVFGAVEWDV